MNRNNKFWWFVIVSISFTIMTLAATGFLFWNQLTPGEKILFIAFFKKHAGFIFGAAVLVLAGFGLTLDWVFRIYILPIGKVADEIALIYSVNPSHRIVDVDGSREIGRLIEAVNEIAERFEKQHENIEDRINFAKETLEEERNILAKVIAELQTGVLICNADCRILLYNKRAKSLLLSGGLSADHPQGLLVHDRFIGLGRSIFGILDKNLVVHVLDDVALKIMEEKADMKVSFVMPASGGRLLRSEAIPVLDHEKLMIGLIFLFSDITREFESSRDVETIFQNLTKQMRSSLSGIRSTVEAMIDYPDMAPDRLHRFQQIIHDESIVIGKTLERSIEAYTHLSPAQWPLMDMRTKDLLSIVRKKSQELFGIELRFEPAEEEIWLKVDNYSIVLALMYLIEQITRISSEQCIECRYVREDGFLALDMFYKGPRTGQESFKKWESERLVSTPLTFGEVLRQHGAEIWSHSKPMENSRACIRILFPAKHERAQFAEEKTRTHLYSRPEFYDFNMFEIENQTRFYDDEKLSDLSYTVFDTETTGLDTASDEIISIGAVRIVKGRIRKEEIFDQLIDPRRSVPWESIKYHGIRPEMLNNQPAIGEVLPLFQKFCDGTILVAHNAAFDMKMLQVKENDTKVSFSNPILDTLLLSAFLHPAHKGHDIEGIAERLGIRVVGRHTALGDALVTAEIFVRLIPLLAQNDIYTLKEARSASKKTYYARLKY